MSQQVANVNLSAATLGPPATTGLVKWGQLLTPATIEQQMQPGQTSGATLLIQNESHAQLTFSFPDTGRVVSWPAGKWAPLKLRANEASLVYTVTGLASNPLFTSLLIDFYWPGEPVDEAGTLGNSPIGGGVPLSVSQVINNANPTPTVVLQSTPSGSSTVTAQITNDGHMLLEPNNPNSASDLAIQVIEQNNPVMQAQDAVVLLQKVVGDAKSRVFIEIEHVGGFGEIGLGDGTVAHTNTLLANTTGIVASGSLGAGGGAFNVDGQGFVKAVAGLTTLSLGVPALIALGLGVAVNNTTATNIINFSPGGGATAQEYMLLAFFDVGAANTNGGVVTYQVTYNDVQSGVPVNKPLLTYSGIILTGAAIPQSTTNISCAVLPIRALANANITLAYQNTAAGTIADNCTALLYRLV